MQTALPASNSNKSGCKPKNARTAEHTATSPRNFVFTAVRPQPPESLQNDCNDDRLDSVQDRGGCRNFTEMYVAPCQDCDNDCCRSNKTTSRDEQSYPSGAQVANMYGQFARTRAWNQIARAEQVEEFLTRKPPSAAHKLIFHYGDMCRWA